jgi:hypothetical protein
VGDLVLVLAVQSAPSEVNSFWYSMSTIAVVAGSSDM